jgi:MobA/MobL family
MGLEAHNLALLGLHLAIRQRANGRQAASHKGLTNMFNIDTDTTKARNLRALTAPDRPTFKAAPIMPPNPADPYREVKRKTHRTAAATWLYISRQEGSDRLGPLPPTYMSKADDLIATGRRHPICKFPPHYRSGRQIWDDADSASDLDPNHAAGVHIIGTLPDGDPETWRRLVERYLDDHFVTLGMVVDWAIHFKRDDDEKVVTEPHFHGLVTARRFRADLRKGARQKTWLFSKAQIDSAEDAWLAAAGLPPRLFT